MTPPVSGPLSHDKRELCFPVQRTVEGKRSNTSPRGKERQLNYACPESRLRDRLEKQKQQQRQQHHQHQRVPVTALTTIPRLAMSLLAC